MRTPTGRAWISKVTLAGLHAEADRMFPEETGGVLVGYWVRPLEEVVITAAVGPGPGSTHSSHSFRPNSEFHERELARFYRESGRHHTYLGDWHTHPRSSAHMSELDRRTLLRIATYAEARASTALMIVLGNGTPWAVKVWCADVRRCCLFPRLGVVELEPEVFDDRGG